MTVDVEALVQAIRPVLAAHREIAVAYLFGSVARGEARSDSDLDLGLVFARGGLPPRERDRLFDDLTWELGQVVPFESIDLVELEPQGPIFCHQVLCDGRLVHEGDADRRIDYESETIVRALDFRPTWELATRGKPAALLRWLEERYDVR